MEQTIDIDGVAKLNAAQLATAIAGHLGTRLLARSSRPGGGAGVIAIETRRGVAALSYQVVVEYRTGTSSTMRRVKLVPETTPIGHLRVPASEKVLAALTPTVELYADEGQREAASVFRAASHQINARVAAGKALRPGDVVRFRDGRLPGDWVLRAGDELEPADAAGEGITRLEDWRRQCDWEKVRDAVEPIDALAARLESAGFALSG